MLALNALTLRILKILSQFACSNILITLHHGLTMLDLAISDQKPKFLLSS